MKSLEHLIRNMLEENVGTISPVGSSKAMTAKRRDQVQQRKAAPLASFESGGLVPNQGNAQTSADLSARGCAQEGGLDPATSKGDSYLPKNFEGGKKKLKEASSDDEVAAILKKKPITYQNPLDKYNGVGPKPSISFPMPDDNEKSAGTTPVEKASGEPKSDTTPVEKASGELSKPKPNAVKDQSGKTVSKVSVGGLGAGVATASLAAPTMADIVANYIARGGVGSAIGGVAGKALTGLGMGGIGLGAAQAALQPGFMGLSRPSGDLTAPSDRADFGHGAVVGPSSAAGAVPSLKKAQAVTAPSTALGAIPTTPVAKPEAIPAPVAQPAVIPTTPVAPTKPETNAAGIAGAIDTQVATRPVAPSQVQQQDYVGTKPAYDQNPDTNKSNKDKKASGASNVLSGMAWLTPLALLGALGKGIGSGAGGIEGSVGNIYPHLNAISALPSKKILTRNRGILSQQYESIIENQERRLATVRDAIKDVKDKKEKFKGKDPNALTGQTTPVDVHPKLEKEPPEAIRGA